MIDSMKLALTKVTNRRNPFRDALFGLMVGLVVLALSACGLPTSLPTQLPVDIPGMPKEWSQIQDLMTQLGVPDLSQLAGIPGLDAFGGEPLPAGAIQFQGPTEMALTPGQSIPGTDIRFVQAEAGADAAQ